MANTEDTKQEEKPLDPAMEKVRRKMVRLLIISISVMFIGLMAVLGAIVYKATRSNTSEPVITQNGSIPTNISQVSDILLPKDFKVLNVSTSTSHITIHGSNTQSSEMIFIFDANTGQQVSEISIKYKP